MNATPPSPGGRGPVVAIAAGGLAWVGVLAWLVLQSANPVVVNRVQIRHADVIVQGTWDAHPSPPQLTVERTWKGTLEAKTIRVRQPEGVNVSRRVIVPLTRISPDLYEVTQGELTNPPELHPLPPGIEPVTSVVRPEVYPSTDDVARQIEALLSPRDIR